jgi:hypothetical protein
MTPLLLLSVSCPQEVEGKSVDEVTEYSKVFWDRYKELHESEKVGD